MNVGCQRPQILRGNVKSLFPEDEEDDEEEIEALETSENHNMESKQRAVCSHGLLTHVLHKARVGDKNKCVPPTVLPPVRMLLGHDLDGSPHGGLEWAGPLRYRNSGVGTFDASD